MMTLGREGSAFPMNPNAWRTSSAWRWHVLRLSFSVFAVVSFVLAITVIWGQAKRAIEQSAIRDATAIASALNGVMIRELDGTVENEGTTAYVSIKSRLETIVDSSDVIVSIRLWTMRDGTAYLAADSALADAESYLAPGTEYTVGAGEESTVFQGGSVVLSDAFTNAWGKWRTIRIPLADAETGTVFAVLDVFYAAPSFYRNAILATVQIALLLLVLYLLILTLIFYIDRSLLLRTARNRIHLDAQQFRALFESSGFGIGFYDVDGKVLSFNRRKAEDMGGRNIDFIGKSVTDLYPKEEASVILARIAEAAATGTTRGYETHADRNHRDRWVLDVYDRIEDTRGETVGVQIITQDITDRKQTEEALEEERRLLDLFFSQSLSGFFIMMLDEPVDWSLARGEEAVDAIFEHQHITRVNKAMLDQYGYEESEMLGRSPHDFFLHDPGQGRKVMRDLFDQGHMHYLTDERRKDGSPLRIEGDYICMHDAKGRIIGHFGVQNDVTERILDEARLKQSETRLRQALQIARLGSWRIDLRERTMWASEESFRIYGIVQDSEYMSLSDAQSSVLPEDRSMMDRALADLIEGKNDYDVEFRIRKRDTGTDAVIHSVAVLETGPDGQPARIVGTIQDITAQKHLELELSVRNEELMLERTRLDATVRSIGDGVISTDADGIVVLMNDVACRLVGIGVGSAVGQRLEDVLTIIDSETGKPLLDSSETMVRAGTTVALTDHASFIDRFGGQRFIDSCLSPVRDPEGEVLGAVLVFRDVTEKIAKQREIEYMYRHDHLTDLYNRRYFYEAFDAFNVEEHLPLGIMMMDVNGLKIVNDAYGHAVGDIALKSVAEIMKGTFRSIDVVARIGGDEFAVLLPGTTNAEMQSFKDLLKVEIEKTEVQNVHISLAIGYEAKTETATTLDDFLKRAENHMYRHKLSEGVSIRNRAIKAILATLTEKYAAERKHSERVSRLCRRMGEELHLRDDELKELELSGMFHDIGKISIPDVILNKPGRLTPEEYEVIKTHAETGYQILRAADEYSDLAIHALSHHEHWDGKGYPKGLAGTDIPLFSRIIGIADAYEAMTADRPYRRGMDRERAVAELLKNAGSQFDPELVSLFAERVREEEHP
jgi:diguanylate cyclase (GGDEF)-like protein/PAS domain S-box-containing protein